MCPPGVKYGVGGRTPGCWRFKRNGIFLLEGARYSRVRAFALIKKSVPLMDSLFSGDCFRGRTIEGLFVEYEFQSHEIPRFPE